MHFVTQRSVLRDGPQKLKYPIKLGRPPLCNIVINRADPSPPIRYYVIYGQPLFAYFHSAQPLQSLTRYGLSKCLSNKRPFKSSGGDVVLNPPQLHQLLLLLVRKLLPDVVHACRPEDFLADNFNVLSSGCTTRICSTLHKPF